MRTFKGFSTVDKTWGNFKLYDLDLVKRDLLNEIYTRKGERLMAPEFGCVVWDVLFDPMTEDTVQIIRDDLVRIIGKDPRIELKDLQVTEDFDTQTIKLVIFINYIPTSTVAELVAVFNRDIISNQLQG